MMGRHSFGGGLKACHRDVLLLCRNFLSRRFRSGAHIVLAVVPDESETIADSDFGPFSLFGRHLSALHNQEQWDVRVLGESRFPLGALVSSATVASSTHTSLA